MHIRRKSLLDNADWLLKLNVVSFLQMLGSGMRVGTMLGRDTYVSPLRERKVALLALLTR